MGIILGIFHSFWFQSIFKLILGAVLAGIIGLERSSWSKPAGFRTHALVGISAVLVVLCGEHMSQIYDIDPSRISAQLLSGIGFIGAGTILRDGFNVKGLTTAAGLLAVTCIGLSIGSGFYLGGILATLIVYIILSYSYKLSDKLNHFDVLELDIKVNENIKETVAEIEKILTDHEIEIKQMKRLKEEERQKEEETIHVVGHYNKKAFKKNELLRKITLIDKVEEVLEEEN